MGNATSGELTLEPTTGAITSYTLGLPAAQPSGSDTYLSCTAANPSVCTWAAGGSGGATAESAITAPTGTNTITETAAGDWTARAGVETANLTSGWSFVNTNSTNNNTDLGLLAGAAGSSTGGIGMLVYDVSGTGDLADFYSGGSVTSNAYTAGTKEASITTGGAINATTSLNTGTPPTCTAGTGGGLCMTEGTNLTNVSSTAALDANSTTHELAVATNGSTSYGMLVRAQPGSINSTGNTATVSIATLCAASAGACNVAGQYHVSINVWGSGTACATPGSGGVTPGLTWTDENSVSHSVVVIPMQSQTSATAVAVETAAPTVPSQTANANTGGSGDFTLSSSGSAPIQLTMTYAACSTGTFTYNYRATVTRLQ